MLVTILTGEVAQASGMACAFLALFAIVFTLNCCVYVSYTLPGAAIQVYRRIQYAIATLS